MKMIFVNLPVTDIGRSRRFYEALGFTINPQFSDDSGLCVVISEAIYLMVMNRERFAGFAPKPVADATQTTGSLIALSCDNRDAVVAMVDAALAHGGTDTGKVQDMEDYMYGRSFCDPDGHVFEPFWMNPAAIEQQS